MKRASALWSLFWLLAFVAWLAIPSALCHYLRPESKDSMGPALLTFSLFLGLPLIPAFLAQVLAKKLLSSQATVVQFLLALVFLALFTALLGTPIGLLVA